MYGGMIGELLAEDPSVEGVLLQIPEVNAAVGALALAKGLVKNTVGIVKGVGVDIHGAFDHPDRDSR